MSLLLADLCSTLIHETSKTFVLTPRPDELGGSTPLLDDGVPLDPRVDLDHGADLLGDVDALLDRLQARDDLRLHGAVLPRRHLARLLGHLLHHSLHLVPKGGIRWIRYYNLPTSMFDIVGKVISVLQNYC